MRTFLRRLAPLLLALMLAAPALAEGACFTLRASINPEACPGESRPLMTALAQLLEAAQLEGTYASTGDSFQLDAQLHLGEGSDASRTTLQLWGIESHWGLRSSLLGDEELMINCAALLPFGQKARSYLELPLDQAALLVPYVHADGLSAVAELFSPLFPEEDGSIHLTRTEMDALASELRRLCDEDARLNRYLESTGMYPTVVACCMVYAEMPELLLPWLTVTRSGDTLTWQSGTFTLLEIHRTATALRVSLLLPTMGSAEAEITTDGRTAQGSVSMLLMDMQASAAFRLPNRLTEEPAPLSLVLDVRQPLIDRTLRLRVEGEASSSAARIWLQNPDTAQPMLTLECALSPADMQPLPAWTPADLTGMNVLSVNSDSLHALLSEVKWPLLEGLFDLIVAAPAPAVQTLMDCAEESGLIDLLTDALAGGSGY